MLSGKGVFMSEEFDTDYTDDPVCPYCGEEQTDSGELFTDNNESAETWCQHCEKEIVITQHISVHYCTYKPDDPYLDGAA